MEDQKQTTTQSPSLSDRLSRAVGVRSAVAPYLASDFGAFARAAFHVVDQARLKWNWHHDLIAEYLTLAQQRRIKRLAISIPPRGLKSMLVSVLWAAWVWITSPHASFICAGHSASLSTDFSLVRRNLKSRPAARYLSLGDRLHFRDRCKSVKVNAWPGTAEMESLRAFPCPSGCRNVVHR